MLINGKNPLAVDFNEDDVPDGSGQLESDVLFEWIGGVDSKVIKVNATGEAGQVITLKVQPTIENNNGFNVGDITYNWTKTFEGVSVNIDSAGDKESDIKDINHETGELTIRVLTPETGGYTYDCVITNTIQDEDKKSDRYSFIIV